LIHGNVKSLIQEYSNLKSVKQHLKRIDYDYDLISGNVHTVRYQEGNADQFFHRYTYDEDNRLLTVETSKDKIIWDSDARYKYYDHGPLARTELGEYSVQGLDYIYTIHGWIKAVNSNSLSHRLDPGQDGNETNLFVANDAFSYSLDYYDGDYLPIRAELSSIQASGAPGNARSLYNGNISKMTTSLRNLQNEVLPVTPSEYTYDQLHRIKKMQKYRPISLSSFSYNGGLTDSYKTEYEYDPNGNILRLNRFDDREGVIDRMEYNYPMPKKNNLLEYIRDAPATIGDFDGQDVGNYKYDGAGNMIVDVSERINKIIWDHYGKIRHITRDANTNLSIQPNVSYHYDAMGNRIEKVLKYDNDPNKWEHTYYVRDASGNVMAIYEVNKASSGDAKEVFLKDHHIYGSSKLGLKRADNPEQNLAQDASLNDEIDRISGLRQYELSNHLGNVLSTVSDNKLLIYRGNAVSLYKPEILSYSDYYPFGWTMPGRAESITGYRYGFNGKEKDDNVKGAGVQYDYGFRIYDSRIARFLSVDPLTRSYPMLTPYQFASNRPIDGIDWDGLEWRDVTHFDAGLVRGVELKLFTSEDVDKFYREPLRKYGDYAVAGAFGGFAASGSLVGLTISYGIEGLGSVITGAKFDFFDATLGGFGPGAYAVFSPMLDITDEGVKTMFDKTALDVGTNYALNGFGFGIGKFIKFKTIKLANYSAQSSQHASDVFLKATHYNWSLGANANAKMLKAMYKQANLYDNLSAKQSLGSMLLEGTINFSDLLFIAISKQVGKNIEECNDEEECDK